MKPALHHSMLSMLSRCGMQVYYRYVEGLRVPPSVAMVVGTAVHRGCEADLISKMTTGKPLPEAAAKQAAADALDAAWAGEEPLLDDDEKDRGKAVVRGEAMDEAVALTGLANRELTPVLRPIALEKRIRLEIAGFPFDVEGTVDVLEVDAIRDRKTAKRSPSAGDVVGNPQLELYSMMHAVQTGTPVKTIALDTLVKTKTPKLFIDETPAPQRFDSIKLRLEMAAKVFESGAFYPVDPTGPNAWVCSKRFCGYYDRCPFGAARKVQV